MILLNKLVLSGYKWEAQITLMLYQVHTPSPAVPPQACRHEHHRLHAPLPAGALAHESFWGGSCVTLSKMRCVLSWQRAFALHGSYPSCFPLVLCPEPGERHHSTAPLRLRVHANRAPDAAPGARVAAGQRHLRGDARHLLLQLAGKQALFSTDSSQTAQRTARRQLTESSQAAAKDSSRQLTGSSQAAHR